jgi:hypothetical protein
MSDLFVGFENDWSKLRILERNSERYTCSPLSRSCPERWRSAVLHRCVDRAPAQHRFFAARSRRHLTAETHLAETWRTSLLLCTHFYILVNRQNCLNTKFSDHFFYVMCICGLLIAIIWSVVIVLFQHSLQFLPVCSVTSCRLLLDITTIIHLIVSILLHYSCCCCCCYYRDRAAGAWSWQLISVLCRG